MYIVIHHTSDVFTHRFIEKARELLVPVYLLVYFSCETDLEVQTRKFGVSCASLPSSSILGAFGLALDDWAMLIQDREVLMTHFSERIASAQRMAKPPALGKMKTIGGVFDSFFVIQEETEYKYARHLIVQDDDTVILSRTRPFENNYRQAAFIRDGDVLAFAARPDQFLAYRGGVLGLTKDRAEAVPYEVLERGVECTNEEEHPDLIVMYNKMNVFFYSPEYAKKLSEWLKTRGHDENTWYDSMIESKAWDDLRQNSTYEVARTSNKFASIAERPVRMRWNKIINISMVDSFEHEGQSFGTFFLLQGGICFNIPLKFLGDKKSIK